MLHLQTINAGTLELLRKIMTDPAFRDFFLVGGTGLALQTGHRISDDLDLFSQNPFDPLQLMTSLKQVGEVQVTGEAKNTLNCFLNGVKLDLIGYPYPLISEMVLIEDIRIAGIPDIAAMKLSAIAQRGAKKDFFDLYEILHIYSLTDLLSFFQLKFPSIDTFHILRSLTYFEDAESEKDPKQLKQYSWKQVKFKIVEAVKTVSL